MCWKGADAFTLDGNNLIFEGELLLKWLVEDDWLINISFHEYEKIQFFSTVHKAPVA